MDKPDLLVISSYPPKGQTHGEGTVGIASYTKNTLLNLKIAAKQQANPKKIVVLAEKLSTDPNDHYSEDDIEVKRVWQRNSLLLYFQLLTGIINHNTKKVMIEFELAMFGGSLSLLQFFFFLVTLKILGKKVYLVMHQVVPNIAELSGHINISEKGIKAPLMNMGISLFYYLTLRLTYKIILFEEALRKKLYKFIDKDKITVIPHGVEQYNSSLTTTDARKTLRIEEKNFVILIFGFIAWYKGTEWLIDAVKHIPADRKIQLIVAGGPNPNHEQKDFYQQYIRDVRASAEASESPITITGFVPEEQLPLYFIASDIVVFPYRTLMSSSGPLSLAYSFAKPFLISAALSPLVETADMQHALNKHHVMIDEVTFPLDPKVFEKKIVGLTDDKSELLRVKNVALSLRADRNFTRIGKMYYNALFP